jgi:hypothetical protein
MMKTLRIDKQTDCDFEPKQQPRQNHVGLAKLKGGRPGQQ